MKCVQLMCIVQFVAAGAATIPVSPAQANFLTNGSFEEGPRNFGANSYITLSAGSGAIPGWVVSAGNIDYLSPSWDASDGQYSLDLDGAFSTGGIQQTFPTVLGELYRITFDLSGNPGGAPQIKQMRVSTAGLNQDFSFDSVGGTPGDLTWSTETWTFQAADELTTLNFSSLGPSGNSWGPLLDNVDVSPVPEPGTGLLAVATFALLLQSPRKSGQHTLKRQTRFPAVTLKE